MEQKSPEYLKINPNGRIPALIDILPSGEKIRVFESGSILSYLAERYDPEGSKISYPKGSPEHYETTSWLFFQNAGLGPMQGQAHHFRRYAPEKIEYGIQRYTKETQRLYSVVECHLQTAHSLFVVGNRVTIADFSLFTWIIYAAWAGLGLCEYPYLKAWTERIWLLPGVRKGSEVPRPNRSFDMTTEEQNAYAEMASRWIQK